MEAVGDPGPWRQQAILGRGRWDADALRDIVREYVIEHLADQDAVLVIDETGFLKQGKASCGVVRQYTGSAGKITNCQIGVFPAYASCHGHAFIDRELYLPKSWTGDPARMAQAHVPAGTGFATKPALALTMIERALATGVPFAWVAAGSVYGVGDIEMALRRAGRTFMLSWVNSNGRSRAARLLKIFGMATKPKSMDVMMAYEHGHVLHSSRRTSSSLPLDFRKSGLMKRPEACFGARCHCGIMIRQGINSAFAASAKRKKRLAKSAR